MRDFNYLPLFQQGMNEMADGLEIKLPDYCAKRCSKDEKCKQYYKELLQKEPGNYVCPYGFSSKLFVDEEEKFVFSGVRIEGIYDAKKADPKIKSVRGKNYRKITEKEAERYAELFLEYKKSTEAYVQLRGFVEDIFHDIRHFNGQMKQKCTSLYNKAHSGKKTGQFEELAHSMSAICAYTTLRLNAYDFMYNESPLSATEKVSYNFYKMFYKVKQCLKERAEERRIRISIDSNGECRDVKAFDCVELLPYIFLDNGIKYSTKGSTIEVKIMDALEKCCFEVKTQSLKLLEGEEEKIFNRGYRGDEARRATGEGMGIGLYTAKRICEIHNATISVKEEVDKEQRSFFLICVEFPRDVNL